MKARRGRSSYLGDRIVGHIDPGKFPEVNFNNFLGAEAVSIILRTLAETLKK